MPESTPPVDAIQYNEIIQTVNEMLSGFWERLPLLIIALCVFFIFYLISKIFKKAVAKFIQKDSSEHQNLITVFKRLGGAVIIFLGLLVALVIAIPGFSAGELIGALGIGSVAIGFAFKDIFQNLLSGILLLINEPFRVGDQIITGDYEGTVERIEIRATHIKTYDSRRVVIPNSQLYTSPVMVNTAYAHRRLEAEIGIGYGDDIERARSAMLDVLANLENVLKDPAPSVINVSLGDSAIILRARWYVSSSDQASKVGSIDKVLTKIKYRLDADGIDMPYPTQVILMHDQTESTDGDRSAQREGWPTNMGSGAATKPARLVGNNQASASQDSA